MADTALAHDVASAAPDFRSLSRQPPTDPDIHSTLSDFLTYTEHFPSHLIRALTLIQSQRRRAEAKIKSVHENTSTYSILPSIKHDRPDPVKLRRDISYALEEAERACRMSVEEAIRLDDECRKESRRLASVVQKLKAQPMPPSRDPTPEQQALTSPNLKREGRMATRGDDLRPEKTSRRMHDKAASKLRGRKIMVPGEVLPPPDPNASPESMSEWTTPRHSPPLLEEPQSSPEKKRSATPRQRSRTPAQLAQEKDRDGDKEKKPPKPRGPRAPGQMGTNAHSAVAGISTSNALLALTRPPDDAPKGSKWLPWVKLTEWEMAKLRKRMKKNAIWVPSQTMVRRELKNLGRGLAGKEAAKARAEATGGTFHDEHNEPDPTKVLISGDDTIPSVVIANTPVYAEEDEDADAELINRGMRLNEAKRLKRQRILEEQQIQAQLAREQHIERSPEVVTKKSATSSPELPKKRKRESTPAAAAVPVDALLLETPDPLTKTGPIPKRQKSSSGGFSTTKVPLAPAADIKPNTSRTRRAATPPASKKPGMTLKMSKAVSEEPPNRRASLRRSSNASLPTAGSVSNSTLDPSSAAAASSTTASQLRPGARRSKRPAPGIVATPDNDSVKVGYASRKAAPRKGRSGGKKDLLDPASAATATGPHGGTGNGNGGAADLGPDEYVDPDEPRYCICGDVSWGTMIACDNEDSCEKEWFHLECVHLEDMPQRRTKWYCPDCRKKLKLGQTSNGLVGRNVGSQGR